MPSPDSINFAAAHKALRKAADAAPEWFDRANDVYTSTRDGKTLILHAIMQGLQAAYEAGRTGRGLPPIRYATPTAGLHAQAEAPEHEESAAPAPRVKRVARAAPAAPAPAVKRFTRGAR